MEEIKTNEDSVILNCASNPLHIEDFYSSVSEYILAKIAESPSSQVAYIMSNMLYLLAQEIFYKNR